MFSQRISKTEKTKIQFFWFLPVFTGFYLDQTKAIFKHISAGLSLAR